MSRGATLWARMGARQGKAGRRADSSTSCLLPPALQQHCASVGSLAGWLTGWLRGAAPCRKLSTPLDAEVAAASIGPPTPGGHDERVVVVAREMDIALQPVRQYSGSSLVPVLQADAHVAHYNCLLGGHDDCRSQRCFGVVALRSMRPFLKAIVAASATRPGGQNARRALRPPHRLHACCWLQRRPREFDEMRDTPAYDLILVMDRCDEREVLREVRRHARPCDAGRRHSAGGAGRGAARGRSRPLGGRARWAPAQPGAGARSRRHPAPRRARPLPAGEFRMLCGQPRGAPTRAPRARPRCRCWSGSTPAPPT